MNSAVPIPVESVPLDDDSRSRLRDLLAADALGLVIGFALGEAVFAFASSPLLDDVERDDFVDPQAAARAHELDPAMTVGLLRFLSTQDLFVEEQGERFWLTPRGRAMFSPAALGWLRLYIGGYRPLMQSSLDLMTRRKRHGDEVRRDPHFVSTGSSMVTSAVCDEVPYRVLERYRARTVADLGCGGGRFLIEWARRHPENRGVGVDISPEAIAASRQHAREAGVEDRVSFVVGDGFDLSAVADQCGEVDLLYSFAMEHELLARGEQAVLDHIDQLAALFPGKRYLMGEPMLHMTQQDGALYWIHVLSHQGIPRNVPGWSELLVRLRRARLEQVYLPEHRKMAGYFDIALETTPAR